MSEVPTQHEAVLQERPEPLDKETGSGEEEAVDALTDYFRRTSRGRIVDLPRWAQ